MYHGTAIRAEIVSYVIPKPVEHFQREHQLAVNSNVKFTSVGILLKTFSPDRYHRTIHKME